MRKVSEYLKNAEECRKLAATMSNPAHTQQLQEMASAWEMLAIERNAQLTNESHVSNE